MRPGDLVLTPLGLRFRGRRYPCVIGRGGVRGDKREGDGATPAGVMRIVDMLYRPDRLARPAPWARPIGPRDLWSDDPALPDYNQPVRAPYPGSHEALRRADPLYDLVLVSDWNRAGTGLGAVPGWGSCIFVHAWRRPGFPTAGCVALGREHLRAIAAALIPGARLIVRPGAWR